MISMLIRMFITKSDFQYDIFNSKSCRVLNKRVIFDIGGSEAELKIEMATDGLVININNTKIFTCFYPKMISDKELKNLGELSNLYTLVSHSVMEIEIEGDKFRGYVIDIDWEGVIYRIPYRIFRGEGWSLYFAKDKNNKEKLSEVSIPVYL